MIDRLLEDANRVSDEQVESLRLDAGERELRDAIVATRRRRPLARRRLPWVAGAALAGAAALLLLFLGGNGTVAPSPERAWAAPALRVANAVPRLLIGVPGWKVTRADEFRVDDGEMSFSDGAFTVDLRWNPASRYDGLIADRDATADVLPPATVAGERATVFRYIGDVDDFTAIWRSGGYTMELRTTGSPKGQRLDRAQYLRLLTSMKPAGVDAWLGAMPASVVLPVDRVKVVTEMLHGIPVPPGFDPASLSAGAAVRDRYQLGAAVTGAVACAWIERWIAGDEHAVEAMGTSREWPILQEMAPQGGWSSVFWEIADSMAGRGEMDVRATYREGLGCRP
jgi:hypothetical protein